VRRLALVCSPVVLAAAAAIAAAAPPASLSDEFDDPSSLARWTVFHGDFGASEVRIADGSLEVVPPTSWWVNGDRAFYAHKPVTGDFVVTARVNATGVDGPMPTRNWSLGGLLVRSPASRPLRESWIALRTGVVDGRWRFERKTTVASQSVLVLSSASGGWTELRVARVGPRFLLLTRPDGGSWRLLWEYRRADLPRTLQVGLDAFSGWTEQGPEPPDLRLRADWIRFRSTGVPARLRARFLAGRVRRAAVLRYLRR